MATSRVHSSHAGPVNSGTKAPFLGQSHRQGMLNQQRGHCEIGDFVADTASRVPPREPSLTALVSYGLTVTLLPRRLVLPQSPSAKLPRVGTSNPRKLQLHFPIVLDFPSFEYDSTGEKQTHGDLLSVLLVAVGTPSLSLRPWPST